LKNTTGPFALQEDSKKLPELLVVFSRFEMNKACFVFSAPFLNPHTWLKWFKLQYIWNLDSSYEIGIVSIVFVNVASILVFNIKISAILVFCV
jgi:hypothetical protein